MIFVAVSAVKIIMVSKKMIEVYTCKRVGHWTSLPGLAKYKSSILKKQDFLLRRRKSKGEKNQYYGSQLRKFGFGRRGKKGDTREERQAASA
jgi:hypothetical protein